MGTDRNYFDIRVGQAFIENWRNYKTGNVKKQILAAINVTEDVWRIFKFDSLDINASEDGRTLVVIVNNRPYMLSELGSGLAQFILVLANAAIQQPPYLLIDEPELNLHPSLQLDFLTTLGSYARQGILFATHSIGLARAGAELIYSLRKIEDGISEVNQYEDTPRMSEFLGELNFAGYRELGVNKVLLVEGSTEIKTIQQFLRKLKKEHEILLLHLGGSSFINGSREAELGEIKRISEDVYSLIDSERASGDAPLPVSRQEFVETCKRVGIRCHVLSYRAIENYMSDKAVKALKGEKYQALGPYQALKGALPAWAKAENWRIASLMDFEELKGTDLGQFLASL